MIFLYVLSIGWWPDRSWSRLTLGLHVYFSSKLTNFRWRIYKMGFIFLFYRYLWMRVVELYFASCFWSLDCFWVRTTYLSGNNTQLESMFYFFWSLLFLNLYALQNGFISDEELDSYYIQVVIYLYFFCRKLQQWIYYIAIAFVFFIIMKWLIAKNC